MYLSDYPATSSSLDNFVLATTGQQFKMRLILKLITLRLQKNVSQIMG